MFAKLNRCFDSPQYVTLRDLNKFTTIVDCIEQGIVYKNIWAQDAQKLFRIIPQRYWKDFNLSEMTINRSIPPHTDSDIRTSINFYIETQNCKTIFYKSKISQPTRIQIENQTDGFIYPNYSELESIGEFVAKPKEIWILDVKKIHSVETSGPIAVSRRALTLNSFLGYNEVYDMLCETGNL